MSELAGLLTKLRKGSRSGLIAVVAGTGQVARSSIEAGADVLMALNAGLYRNLGTGSLAAFLPYGNANEQTESLLLNHILPRAGSVPIIAGVYAGDRTRSFETVLRRFKDLGSQGIVNWPAVGFIDGRFRQAIEAAGLGVSREAEMLAMARSMGMVACGFALAEEEVAAFVRAGVDCLVLDLGLTRDVEGVVAKRDQLQRAIARLNTLLSAARKDGVDRVCLAFGGPIVTADDLAEVLRHSPVNGFAGGSVFERLPVHDVVATKVRAFKTVAVSRHAGGSSLGEMIGASAPIQEVFTLVRRTAPYDVNVCIEGESGTGKELVASLLHQMSNRAGRPFVTLNCGAIPDSLLEAELFGYERGSFTGADRRRLGKFELARGGTLFLDEIADLSPRGQVAMLRALQQREITRIGGEMSIPVDVRIIAASNRPLAQAVAEGRFRADLYYRLNYLTIPVPPLRDRLDDLPLLVNHILSRLQVQLNRKLIGVSPEFLKKLRQHSWPGNVRELQHVLGEAALREEGPDLRGRHFVPAPVASTFRTTNDNEANPFANGTRERRQQLAQQALKDANGNKSQAAKSLEITRKTLYAWLS